jgi:hypothetical protein
METYKEDKRMDELFRKAREEKPLMHLDEIKNVLPANQPIIPHAKGWHFSISHIIVVSGIIISSGLAYLTMKTDKINKADTTPKTEQASQTPVEPIKENNLSTTSTPVPTNNNHLIASTDKKLISPPVIDRHKKVSLNEEFSPSEKFTTVATLNHDGKRFRVTMVATKVVDVEIDGVSITPEEYEQYSEVLANAKGVAEARIKEEGDKQFLINFFDKHLRSDKITADENHYVFQLTDSKLLIDGVAQSDEMFVKYSRLFKEQAGKEVAKGDEYQFKMSRKQLVTKELLDGSKVKED